MNIKIGDIVRFLTEKLEGKVTSIADKSTVNVFVDEYGFEIPAAISDLVVIHSDITPPTTSLSGNQNQKQVQMQSADTLYLAIVPDNFNNLAASRYELFIVNDTAQTCLYSVSFRQDDKYNGILAGNCPPDSASSLGLYSIKDIDSRIKAVSVQAVFFHKGTTTLKNPVDAEVKISTVTLCKAGAYKHTRWFNSISLLRPLSKEQSIELEDIDERQLKEALKEKKVIDTPNITISQPSQPSNSDVIEIDLHTNEVLETTAGMDSKDILEYQLDIFHKTMEKYKLKRGQKIVFIHGKGEGVLRQRILWELQRKYKRHNHQDASFKQYGYGATLVTIK